MLQKNDTTPCFLCGAVPGPWNEPAAAADPGQAGAELLGLEDHLRQLVSGRTTPEELHAHLLEMCAMCQEIVMDVGKGASKDDVVSRMQFRIARLHRQTGAQSGVAL